MYNINVPGLKKVKQVINSGENYAAYSDETFHVFLFQE